MRKRERKIEKEVKKEKGLRARYNFGSIKSN